MQTSSRQSPASLTSFTTSTPAYDYSTHSGDYGDDIFDSNILDALDPSPSSIDTGGMDNDIDLFLMDAPLEQPPDYNLGSTHSTHSSDSGVVDAGVRGTPTVTFTNTRMLGRSHWKTAFDQVCSGFP